MAVSELLELIETYENKNQKDGAYLRLFSDGSGSIRWNDRDIFDFDNVQQLIEKIQN